MSELDAKKKELRARLIAERSALSPAQVRAASAELCSHLARMPQLARAGRIAVYAAVRGEIDPLAIADSLRARGSVVAYPRIHGEQLEFRVAHPGELREGRLGIYEPTPFAQRVGLDMLDVVIVPAVALDRAGVRLGFGRGYYDRALAAAPRAVRVGICHAFQLVDELPRHEGDQPVDFVVTPDGARATGARQAPEEVPT